MDTEAVDNPVIHGDPSRLIRALAGMAQDIKRYVIAAINTENCPL
jgi:hypothetical protein